MIGLTWEPSPRTMSTLALRVSTWRRLSTSLTVFSNNFRFLPALGIQFLWILLNFLWFYFYSCHCWTANKTGHIHSDLRYHHFRSTSRIIRTPPILQTWCTWQCYVWLGFRVCVTLLPKSGHGFGHEPPFHFRLPSRRQWSDGTGKPNIGTVLTLLLQFPTG